MTWHHTEKLFTCGSLSVVLRGIPKIGSIWSGDFNSLNEGKLSTAHIFYKELEVAVRGLESFQENNQPHRIIPVLVTDNTGVAGALRRGWSTSVQANEMIARIKPWVRDSLIVVTV